MSDAAAKYTQCPFCETAFKLSSQQLILAKGLVRCGSCKEVFRADQRLMSSPPVLTERVRSARIKSSPQAPTTPPPPAPAKTAAAATTESEDNFNIDMGSEVEGTAPSDGDTSYTPIIEQDFAANAPSQHAAQRFQHAQGESDQHDRSTLASSNPKAHATRKPTTKDVDSPAAMEPIDGDIISHQTLRELAHPIHQSQEHSHQWRYIALSVVLLLSMVLQGGWFSRDRWLQNAEVRRSLTPLCESMNCDFPTWDAPDEIAIIARDLQPHPTLAQARQLQLTLRNNAQWPQAYPQLQLRFYDLNRRVIAARVFNPVEYLGAPPADLLAPNAELQVALELVDPGQQAVNYDLAFL